jgi:hypothetical protein
MNIDKLIVYVNFLLHVIEIDKYIYVYYYMYYNKWIFF